MTFFAHPIFYYRPIPQSCQENTFLVRIGHVFITTNSIRVKSIFNKQYFSKYLWHLEGLLSSHSWPTWWCIKLLSDDLKLRLWITFLTKISHEFMLDKKQSLKTEILGEQFFYQIWAYFAQFYFYFKQVLNIIVIYR